MQSLSLTEIEDAFGSACCIAAKCSSSIPRAQRRWLHSDGSFQYACVNGRDWRIGHRNAFWQTTLIEVSRWRGPEPLHQSAARFDAVFFKQNPNSMALYIPLSTLACGFYGMRWSLYTAQVLLCVLVVKCSLGAAHLVYTNVFVIFPLVLFFYREWSIVGLPIGVCLILWRLLITHRTEVPRDP